MGFELLLMLLLPLLVAVEAELFFVVVLDVMVDCFTITGRGEQISATHFSLQKRSKQIIEGIN